MIYNLGQNFEIAIDDCVAEVLNGYCEGEICHLRAIEDIVTNHVFNYDIAADDIYLFSETIKTALDEVGMVLE